jgi:hypothetical protein
LSKEAPKGDAGLIVELTEDKLPMEDLSKVAATVPGAPDLAKAAPKER